MKTKLVLIGFVASLAIVVGVCHCVGLPFAKFDRGQLASQMGSLFVLALLIERTIEVIFTVWRSAESYKRQAAVQRLTASGTAADAPEMAQAQEALIEFRAETQQWSLPLSTLLGVMVAACGPRVIEPLLVVPSGLEGTLQLRAFHAIDILLTGTLLAGGADPIHKFMDALRKFLEATAAKSAGTRA